MTTTPWSQDEGVLPQAHEGTFGVLDEGECCSLLHAGVIGRVAFTSPHLSILPITYAVVEGLVVYRTSETSPLAGLAGQSVAFEVDDLDSETGVGWSVLVAGVVEEASLAMAAGIHPWAAGERPLVFAIRPQTLTGRVVSRPDLIDPPHPERK